MLLAPLRGEILAPGDDVHAESLCHLRDALAEIAEPDQTEGMSKKVGPHRRLPGLAGLHAGILFTDVAGEIDHQSDREFGCGMLCALGPTHKDAAILGRRDIDRGILQPGGHDQLQVRQLLDQAARKRGPLAHQADNAEALQSARDGRLVA